MAIGVAIAVAIVVISTAFLIIRVWGRQKFPSNGQRAIERLSKLARGAASAPEPTLKPRVAPQIEPEVQTILEREEPWNSETPVKSYPHPFGIRRCAEPSSIGCLVSALGH